jgi:Methyltransferase domain
MEARNAALLSDHLNASLRRLPGPAYYRVLNWIHRFLKPVNYVEIGVHKGVSLLQAVPGTPCVIGVDPEPSIEGAVEQSIERRLPATRIYERTSDEFFARYDLGDLLGGPVALAFIDGLHLFEQVLQDFVNLEKHSDAGTVILLHDCLPLDEVTASRNRTTDFYCGDVWKAALALRRLRPELEMVTVRTPPTGLCLVRGLDAGNQRLEQQLPEIAASYCDLDFDYYLAHRDEMPDEVPNERKAVGAWLRRRRVAQP